MEAVARLRNCPMSARKMRLVVDNVRGKSVEDALNILKFTNKEAAIWLHKVVLSAVSNWANKNESSSPEDAGLFIKTAFVDGGTSIKRFRPAPHGRANRIRKRMNHVTIIVDSKSKVEA
jgi:large subunit ribosomal protein L22